MRPLAFAILLLLAPIGAAKSQTYYADISGQTVNIYVPEGFCALTGENQNEAVLLDYLAKANAGVNEVLIAFADCGQLQDWNSGGRAGIDNFGYMATPVASNLRAFPGTQDDLNLGLETTYNQQFGAGLKQGERRAQALLDQLQTGVRIEETQPLGYFGYDPYGTYVGLAQRLSTEQGLEKTMLGIFSTITVQERLIFFYLWDAYTGDAQQVNHLLEVTQIYSRNQHEVN